MQINPSSPPSIPATSPQLPLAESENVPESSSTLKDHKFSLNTMLFNVKKNDAVKISLANQEQWAKFHEIGTEMMVFNSGRRLFPLLAYKVSGLDPHKLYCAGVHMIPDSAYKQEYDHDLQQWVNCLNQKKTIFKPTSEILGRIENGFKLMSLGIDMSDVKIFNIAIRKKTPLQIEKSRKPNLDKTVRIFKRKIKLFTCNFPDRSSHPIQVPPGDQNLRAEQLGHGKEGNCSGNIPGNLIRDGVNLQKPKNQGNEDTWKQVL